MTSTTIPSRLKQVLAVSGVLAASSLALSACGSSANGEYVNYGKGVVPYIITIDGDDATYDEIDCNGSSKADGEHKASGQLNDDKSEIVWTQRSQVHGMSGTSSLSITDDAITVDGEIYHKKDSEEGKALLDDKKQRCAEKNS